MRSFLSDLARAAGAVLMEHRGALSAGDIEFKGPRDLVSYVDRKAEDVLRQAIAEAYPDDAFLGEESGGAEAAGGRRWIVDPLDGTTNYLHGLPAFCVSIGVEEEGELVAGCVFAPATDELFLAEKGQGATLNGEPISVSDCSELPKALLVTGFADFRSHELLRTTRLERALNRAGGVRRMGSAALDLVKVAQGHYDGFFEWNLNPWDVAGGAVIVREAGGTVTDGHGGDGFLTGRSIVAAPTPLHPALLGALEEPLGEDRLPVLQDRMAEFVGARGWQQWHSPKNLAMALSVEASELLELFQWVSAEELAADGPSSELRARAGEELADVLAYACSMANALGLDLAQQFTAKMLRNAEKYPVGGATPRYWGSGGRGEGGDA